MAEFPVPCVSSPKTHRFILFQYTNVHLCAKFGDLKTIGQQSTKSDVIKFGPVSEQGAETTFRKEAAIFFPPTVS